MPLSPVISIPMPYTSTRTPCNLVCGANLSDKYIVILLIKLVVTDVVLNSQVLFFLAALINSSCGSNPLVITTHLELKLKYLSTLFLLNSLLISPIKLHSALPTTCNLSGAK